MNKKFQYTSNTAGGKWGIVEVSDKSYTRYEKQSNTGFYLAMVSLATAAGTLVYIFTNIL